MAAGLDVHSAQVVAVDGLVELGADGDQPRPTSRPRPSNEQFRALFDHGREPVFILDRDGRFLDANRADLRAAGAILGLLQVPNWFRGEGDSAEIEAAIEEALK